MENIKIPTYIRIVFVLLGISLTVLILMAAGDILRPLIYSLFFAIMLHPLCTKLERMRFPKLLATLICVSIPFILIGGGIYLLSSQASHFAENAPALQAKIISLNDQLAHLIKDKVGSKNPKIAHYLNESISKITNESGGFISSILISFTTSFISFFLFYIYLFFTLYYRRESKKLILDLFKNNKNRAEEVLIKIQRMVKSYLFGALIVVIIVAILNSTGLYFLGIDYALLFGLLAAVLNLIPYIGILTGACITMLFTLATKESMWPTLGSGFVFLGVHLLEANIITPNIIGGKVNLNPFASILGLIIWYAIWGISGMILAIPLMGICKIIFDSVDSLKPIGHWLGKNHIN